MNKLQPCGMVWWRGWWKKRHTHTHRLTHHTHTLQSPATVFSFPSFHHNTHTHICTHTLDHKAPSVLGPSVHQLMRSAGLGVLIITLLSGGLTKAHSHHAHMHKMQCAKGDCLLKLDWLNVWCDSSLSRHWLERSLIGKWTVAGSR